MNSSVSEILTDWQGHGVAFQYPDAWDINEEMDGDDVIVTVAADDSCFWILRVLSDCPRPADVADSCLEALREEYDDVEVRETKEQLSGMPATCRELEFSCYELLNTVELRCVRSLQLTLLVWWQATDLELVIVRPHFDRMMQSVKILALES